MHGALVLILAILPACADEASAEEPRGKLIIADYFAHHTSRPHDGRLGPWQQDLTAKESGADQVRFVYNADLVDDEGRHQLAAPAYPLLGIQSDLDPDYQEFQILLAKAAHIDGFVLEWVMPGDLSSDYILRSIVETARRYDFRIGVNWLDGTFFDWVGRHRPEAKSREDAFKVFRESLEYLVEGVYSSNVGLRVDGHPLILLFSGPSAPTPEEFTRVIEKPLELSRGIGRPWFIRRAGVGTKPEHAAGYYNKWAPVMDGMFGWVSIHSNQAVKPMPPEFEGKVDHWADSDHMRLYQPRVRKLGSKYLDRGQFSYRMNSAVPGFDNRGCAGWGRDLAVMGRDEGRNYRNQWEHHVEHRDEIDGVLVVTWNDYTEATVVEPTLEHGYREIETTERYAARFKQIPSDPAGLRLPERLFRLRKQQEFLARTGFEVSGHTSKMDRAGRLIAGRKYESAADILTVAEERFAALQDKISEQTIRLERGNGFQVVGDVTATEGTFEPAASEWILLRVDEPSASTLRDNNFDGFLYFDYLDEGPGRVTAVQSPVRRKEDRPDRKATHYWEVCSIHKTGTGRWISARVPIYKVNAAIDHKGFAGSDFGFRGGVKLRDIRFEFTVYHGHANMHERENHER